jgi:hypothetical protein
MKPFARRYNKIMILGFCPISSTRNPNGFTRTGSVKRARYVKQWLDIQQLLNTMANQKQSAEKMKALKDQLATLKASGASYQSQQKGTK